MRTIRNLITGARRELVKRTKILLLIAFPFADQITGAIAGNLPIVAPFIPENIYKWVGPFVVLIAVLIDAYKKRKENQRGS